MTLTNNFSSMQVNACRSVLNDFSNGYKSDIKPEKIVTAQDVQNLKLDLSKRIELLQAHIDIIYSCKEPSQLESIVGSKIYSNSLTQSKSENAIDNKELKN